MEYRFVIHDTPIYAGENPWPFLSCVFDPGWHQDDADEMVPSEAINWLNERTTDYRIDLAVYSIITDHGHDDRDINQTTFIATIADPTIAAFFRLAFPSCKLLNDFVRV